MSNGLLVIAKQGGGKSTALGHTSKEDLGTDYDIEGLNPAETILVNVKGKPLPFRGWKNQYIAPISAGGNYLVSTEHQKIIDVMSHVNLNRPEIKNFVIDDAQYLMAEEFMKNALKTGFEKFSKLAKNMYDLINAGLNMRDDINFIVLTHVEETIEMGVKTMKMKTIGKLLDEKVTLEGLFTIVMYLRSITNGETKRTRKEFVTNDDGEYPSKSPIGMFKELYIPNDLGLVVRAINAYNNGE